MLIFTTEVEYLGWVVSQGQVRLIPRKEEALIGVCLETSSKSGSGLAGYFRQYIEGFATLTACIAKLIKKTKTRNGPTRDH